MTRHPEPAWLDSLLRGDLTPDVPVAPAGKHGDPHRGSPAMAEVACVAALSGRATPAVVKLLDPTVGRGVMLQTVSKALGSIGSEVHATGIDINQEALESTAASIGATRGRWNPRLGNVLTDDVVPLASMDLVISEPPWGIDWRAHESAVKERSQEGWYSQGLGRVNDAGWLFLQRGLAAMRSREHGGSRFVTFVNPKLLFDREGRDCRRWLVEEDLLEALVRLPAGLAEIAEIPLYALVLRTDKPASLLGRAHVIDLRGYMTTRDSGARRRINGDGLKLLWSALETRRQGPSNRIVKLDSFKRHLVTVSANGDSSLSFRTETSSADPGTEIQDRYGPVPVEWSEEGPGFVSFNVENFFDSPRHRNLPRGARFTGSSQSRV